MQAFFRAESLSPRCPRATDQTIARRQPEPSRCSIPLALAIKSLHILIGVYQEVIKRAAATGEFVISPACAACKRSRTCGARIAKTAFAATGRTIPRAGDLFQTVARSEGGLDSRFWRCATTRRFGGRLPKGAEAKRIAEASCPPCLQR